MMDTRDRLDELGRAKRKMVKIIMMENLYWAIMLVKRKYGHALPVMLVFRNVLLI